MAKMPQVLKFEDMPGVLTNFHVEPFRDAYVPGSRVLCREKSGNGPDVFFHIPNPVAANMREDELEKLKRQVRDWWQAKVVSQV